MEQEEIKVRLAIVDLALAVLTAADDDPRKSGAIEYYTEQRNALMKKLNEPYNVTVRLKPIKLNSSTP